MKNRQFFTNYYLHLKLIKVELWNGLSLRQFRMHQFSFLNNNIYCNDNGNNNHSSRCYNTWYFSIFSKIWRFCVNFYSFAMWNNTRGRDWSLPRQSNWNYCAVSRIFFVWNRIQAKQFRYISVAKFVSLV